MGTSTSGIEVNGKTGIAILAGFGRFSLLGSQFLLEVGIGREGEDGAAVIDPQAWYPLESWLEVLRRVRRELGDRVLSQIGWAMPRGGPSPAHHHDAPSALSSLDVAFHKNHRRAGRLLFDEATHELGEGIGHYAYRADGTHGAHIVCDTPYPCAFDLAIVHSLAARWAPDAKAVHAPGGCRNDGAAACTYHLTW